MRKHCAQYSVHLSTIKNRYYTMQNCPELFSITKTARGGVKECHCCCVLPGPSESWGDRRPHILVDRLTLFTSGGDRLLCNNLYAYLFLKFFFILQDLISLLKVCALFLPVVRLFECCLFILVDPLPLVFSDLPTRRKV